jgi:hypothetical protein
MKVGDFDIEIVERMNVKHKLEVSDNGTGGLDVVLSRTCVLEEQSDPGCSFIYICDDILRLGSCKDNDGEN